MSDVVLCDRVSDTSPASHIHVFNGADTVAQWLSVIKPCKVAPVLALTYRAWVDRGQQQGELVGNSGMHI